MPLAISLTLPFQRTAKSRPQNAAAYEIPPEIWVGPIGEWRQLTNNNSALISELGQSGNLEWTNEGFNIQGWLLSPAKSSPARNIPWLFSSMADLPAQQRRSGPPAFGMSRAIIAALSSRGYYVLLPNPRGSYGQGEDFTRANVKDFGGGDLRDILAGVDAAIKKYPIDPARLGVTGWSYGGYMTMWTVTQTNRFHAAVAGAGIANWQSYYGQNLIDQWMIPFFGASVYDDPAVYEKSSPIRVHQKSKDPDPSHCRRTRCGMPCVAVLRILARFKNARRADAAYRLSGRRPYVHRTQSTRSIDWNKPSDGSTSI